MEREDALNEYFEAVRENSAKARQIIKKLNFKDDSYLLRCIAITYIDEALLDSKNNLKVKFDQRKLSLAKKYIDKAYSLNPECRDVLFAKGSIYNALGDTFLAIDCYIKILELKKIKTKNVNCAGGDYLYINMIYNDSYFQLYRLFYDIGKYETANGLLAQYKNGLKKGIDTIYKPLSKFLME